LLTEGVPGALFDEATWTPAGDALVYAYTRHSLPASAEYVSRIERVGADGQGREVLVDNAQAPGLAPDGRTLAFVRRDTAGDALLVLDGAAVRTLVPAGRFASLAHPRFAPDGATIAFAASTTETAGAPAAAASVAADAASGPPPLTLLARVAASLLRPATALAHGLPWDVWTVRPDGSDLRRLTELREDDPSLAWAPHGQWLALQGLGGLYLVDSGSRRVVRLADGADHGRIDWGP
jgi:Tol biopolymer transport system component